MVVVGGGLLVVVRLALPPGAALLPRLGAAEDLLLLQRVGHGVDGVFDGAGEELQSGTGGGLLWKRGKEE